MLAHAGTEAVWITLQVHRNVVAVASLRRVVVVLTRGVRPDEEVVRRAIRRWRVRWPESSLQTLPKSSVIS